MSVHSEEEVKRIVSSFMEAGLLVDGPLLKHLQTLDEDELAVFLKESKQKGTVHVVAPLVSLPPSSSDEQLKNLGLDNTSVVAITPTVTVLVTHGEDSSSKSVDDFVGHFVARYKTLERLLRNRPGFVGLTTIARVLQKTEREAVSVIGMVKKKSITKHKRILIEVEDTTGTIPVIIDPEKKEELGKFAADIIEDEVIGITGTTGGRAIFADHIVQPDIIEKLLRKSPDEAYAIFISDLHVGSNYFLPDQFQQFLRWLRGEIGSEEQKRTAALVKYVFIIGDLVDGVGIYPGQEEELTYRDVRQQYEVCASYLSQIPKSKHLIICPGNHDALRLEEPQPAFLKNYSAALWNLPNTTMVSNPSLVTIHSAPDFPGFDVLLYHGYSFDHYIASVESIRNHGGYDKPENVMTFLLKRRHLAPTQGSTVYVPSKNSDPLTIQQVPDFFVTGHLHKTAVSSYKNITLICGSCWQSTTPFQERVGHNPEPCRVPLVNLQTRKVKVLKF
ncbi:DNA-directed DNA polymerase II small subunit [Candidatus Woesearchaeota archaeon]|nr:DNA-directed DNA polymerase II small subunit [Candidatus Woesearchaeota archaeon]